ncbi:MAG: flagellar hook-basal body complex protein FliE [Candidatus Cloacimonadota bacterium]|nr:MAG: flagellar hook-basal body complex protein FliE [Candidatus Cloacimonadota bacterium]
MSLDFLKINEKMVSSFEDTINIKPKNAVDKAVGNFADYMEQAVEDTNDLSIQSKDVTKKFLMGEIENVHDVMIASERAGLAMKTMMSLRKKIMEAYRDISSTRL